MKNVMLLFLLLLCGCRTEYVPVESVRYDSLFFSKLIRDSVYVRDRGDTVFKYKNKYVYVYKDRVDTFFVYRDKEIQVPVPVERKLSWWERVKLDFGGWVMLIVFIAFLWRLKTWFARRIRKE
jgi:hypothetical protein